MVAKKAPDKSISCQCGQVSLLLSGEPFATAACYCGDCQKGSARLEALAGAGPVSEEDGASAYMMYRKDRVSFAKGKELLKSHRLHDEAPTDRVVASCCNTALFLNYRAAHWFSIYRRRLETNPPAIAMGLFAESMPGLDRDSTPYPTYGKFPIKFIFRAVKARIAMVFS